MARSRIRIDPSARTHVDAAINRWLEESIGRAILGDAQNYVHKRTGRLRDSLRAEVHDKVLRVGSLDCNYAASVELGSFQPVIKAKYKKALFWEGADHPVRAVYNHRTKPYPYLRPALFQRRTP
jgi:hypothetical protein